jgi:hypothetical protein
LRTREREKGGEREGESCKKKELFQKREEREKVRNW